jgi:hypothetical protein
MPGAAQPTEFLGSGAWCLGRCFWSGVWVRVTTCMWNGATKKTTAINPMFGYAGNVARTPKM